jgi:hypothetical protein
MTASLEALVVAAYVACANHPGCASKGQFARHAG